MNINNTSPRYFRSTNFYLSAFLFAKGFFLANATKIENQKLEFVFIDSSDLRGLISTYFRNPEGEECLVPAGKLFTALKNLKDLVHNGF